MPKVTDILYHAQHFASLHIRVIRYAGIGILSVLFLMVAIQLVYPRDRLLPGATVGMQSVGGKTVAAATQSVKNNYRNAVVELHIDNKVEQGKYREIGIDVSTDTATKKAARYSIGQRLIPFSFFTRHGQKVPASFDNERLQYFAEQVSKKYSVTAVNASLKVDGNTVKLIPARPSKQYKAADIAQSIRRAVPQVKTHISLAAVTTDPPRNDNSVQEVLKKAQKIVGAPMTLTIAGQQIPVAKEIVASWLSFPEDPKTQKLALSVNAEAVHAYIAGLMPKAYKAPGVTTITLVDGQETARVSGAVGQGLDIDGTTAKVVQAITDQQALSLSLATTTIPAKITYQRSYTDEQTGLAALINDLGSSSVSIAAIELGGKGRVANSGGSKRYEAASTYKLFVAYAVIQQIEAGSMSWSDQITGGRDAASCFEAMIVVSDNPCGNAFGEKIGWARIDDMMRGIGLVSTSLNNGFYTSANDLATYLQKLASGSLLSASGSARLLDAMKRQVYRSGIPAGTKVSVADKVGFIGSYLHDAGIVYGASGTYVLVFMTSGSSWSAIANASSQIHAYFNR